MEKHHCSNTSGFHQPEHHGNLVIHQNYQQSQHQITQTGSYPQDVYQPSFRWGQSANMTPSNFDGYNKQVNSAQWSQSNIISTNQNYKTGKQSFQTPQQNYLRAYTAVPSNYQASPATQQSAQNYNRTPYFAKPNIQYINVQQTQAAMSSNSHNLPQHQYGTSRQMLVNGHNLQSVNSSQLGKIYHRP